MILINSLGKDSIVRKCRLVKGVLRAMEATAGFQGHVGEVLSLAASDAGMLLSGAEDGARLWSVKVGVSSHPCAIKHSSSSCFLLPQLLGNPFCAHHCWLHYDACTWVVVRVGLLPTCIKDRSCIAVLHAGADTAADDAEVAAVALSPTDEHAAFTACGEYVRFYDLRDTSAPVAELELGADDIGQLTVHHKGRYLVSTVAAVVCCHILQDQRASVTDLQAPTNPFRHTVRISLSHALLAEPRVVHVEASLSLSLFKIITIIIS